MHFRPARNAFFPTCLFAQLLVDVGAAVRRRATRRAAAAGRSALPSISATGTRAPGPRPAGAFATPRSADRRSAIHCFAAGRRGRARELGCRRHPTPLVSGSASETCAGPAGRRAAADCVRSCDSLDALSDARRPACAPTGPSAARSAPPRIAPAPAPSPARPARLRAFSATRRHRRRTARAGAMSSAACGPLGERRRRSIRPNRISSVVASSTRPSASMRCGRLARRADARLRFPPHAAVLTASVPGCAAGCRRHHRQHRRSGSNAGTRPRSELRTAAFTRQSHGRSGTIDGIRACASASSGPDSGACSTSSRLLRADSAVARAPASTFELRAQTARTSRADLLLADPPRPGLNRSKFAPSAVAAAPLASCRSAASVLAARDALGALALRRSRRRCPPAAPACAARRARAPARASAISPLVAIDGQREAHVEGELGDAVIPVVARPESTNRGYWRATDEPESGLRSRILADCNAEDRRATIAPARVPRGAPRPSRWRAARPNPASAKVIPSSARGGSPRPSQRPACGDFDLARASAPAAARFGSAPAARVIAARPAQSSPAATFCAARPPAAGPAQAATSVGADPRAGARSPTPVKRRGQCAAHRPTPRPSGCRRALPRIEPRAISPPPAGAVPATAAANSSSTPYSQGCASCLRILRLQRQISGFGASRRRDFARARRRDPRRAATGQPRILASTRPPAIRPDPILRRPCRGLCASGASDRRAIELRRVG